MPVNFKESSKIDDSDSMGVSQKTDNLNNDDSMENGFFDEDISSLSVDKMAAKLSMGFPDIPFKFEIILWENEFTLEELLNFAQEKSIILPRSVKGWGVLRIGNIDFAVGKVIVKRGKYFFKIKTMINSKKQFRELSEKYDFRKFSYYKTT